MSIKKLDFWVKDDTENIERFINECTIHIGITDVPLLYEGYLKWAEEQEIKPIKKSIFSKKILKLAPSDTEISLIPRYRAYRLRW